MACPAEAEPLPAFPDAAIGIINRRRHAPTSGRTIRLKPGHLAALLSALSEARSKLDPTYPILIIEATLGVP
jgi:hypothetical protein